MYGHSSLQLSISSGLWIANNLNLGLHHAQVSTIPKWKSSFINWANFTNLWTHSNTTVKKLGNCTDRCTRDVSVATLYHLSVRLWFRLSHRKVNYFTAKLNCIRCWDNYKGINQTVRIRRADLPILCTTLINSLINKYADWSGYWRPLNWWNDLNNRN